MPSERPEQIEINALCAGENQHVWVKLNTANLYPSSTLAWCPTCGRMEQFDL